MKNILSQDLIKELQIDTLPAEQQGALLERIGAVLFEAIILRVMQELSEVDQEKLTTLLEVIAVDETDTLFNFLQERIPHLNQIIDEETARFKAASKEFIDATGKGLALNE